MKYILKIVLYSVEFFSAFILFYLTLTLICMSIEIGDKPSQGDITIYMKSDGIHTDYVFPVQTIFFDWTKRISPDNTRGKDSTNNFISIGWGDQGFFLNTPEWSDVKVSTVFYACFYLGKSALHTNYLKELDFKYTHVKLVISSKQYRILCNYVTNSMKKNRNGNYSCIKNRGYWDTDSFYETNGSYGLFNTCNTWINTGLINANLPACSWTSMNSGIFHKYR